MLALLLAMITLLMVVVSCNGDGDTNKGPGGHWETVDDRYDENNRLKDALPNLNYLGEEITVMYWNDCENLEFEVKTLTGDNVSDAIFDRNNRINDRLNVELIWSPVAGNANNQGDFVAKVQNYAYSGTHDVDIIAAYSRAQATLAVQGMLIDLATIQDSYINFDMPWWPAQMQKTVSFGNSFYFLTGDISTNLLHMMDGLYFNKTMLEEDLGKSADELYQLVYDGKWTIDALIELCTGIGQDIDGIPGKTKLDRYGFSSRYDMLDCFYIGANLRYIESSEEDWLQVSDDYSSRRTVALTRKVGQAAATLDWGLMLDPNDPAYLAAYNDCTTFHKGLGLVIQRQMQLAEQLLVGSVKWSYGVLPTPKYNEKQLNYYTSVSNPHTLYGLFVDLDDRGDMEETLQMMSAVLECWASEAYRLTTPEVFEVNMQLKYSEGQDETNMFEYIRMGITMDLGRIFSNELNKMASRIGLCMSKKASWSSFYGSYRVSLESKLNDMVETFKYYQENRDH